MIRKAELLDLVWDYLEAERLSWGPAPWTDLHKIQTRERELKTTLREVIRRERERGNKP